MLWTLVKIRFQSMAGSMFRNRRKKGVSAGMKLLAALLVLYVAGIFAFLSYSLFAKLCAPFHQLGIDWFLFAFMVLAAFCLMFVGSVFFAQSQMYEARDNELLLSLPIPVFVILGSRIVMFYLMNLVYGVVILVPGMAAYAATVGMRAEQAAPFLLVLLLLPLLAVAVSSVMGALLTFISGRIKRKSLVTMILYLGFLAAYCYGYTKLMDGINYLAANGTALADAMKETFLPLYQAGQAMADGDLFCLGMTLLYILVPFGAVYAALAKSFLTVITAQKGGSGRKYRRKELKAASAAGALLKKEWAHFLASPGYMLNSSFGVILLLGAAVFLIFQRDYIEMAALLVPGAKEALPLGAASMICTILGTVIVSAASISLEGKYLWIYQSSPVAPMALLRSKLAFHLMISLPGAVIASAIAAALLRPSAAEIVLMLLVPAVFCVFGSELGLLINLKFPRFDFISETAVVKNSVSSVTALFAQALVGFAPLGLYLILPPLQSLGALSVLAAYLVLLLAGAAALYRVIAGWGVRTLAELGN